jgi:alpha-glucosidase
MGILKKAYISIRRIGIKDSLNILKNTIHKGLEDRAYGVENIRRIAPPGNLAACEPIQNGAHFRFENAELEVAFLAEELARLTWTPGKISPPYGIARTEWGEVHPEIRDTHLGWQISTRQMTVSVWNDGTLQFFDPQKGLFRQEYPPLIARLDGRRHARTFTSWLHFAKIGADTAIYGLGEKAGSLDLSGKSFKMWNRDPGGIYKPGEDPLYIGIPVYLSLNEKICSLVFYENPYPATFSFKTGVPSFPKIQTGLAGQDEFHENEIVSAWFEDGTLRYYLAAGTPQSVLERYCELTGRPPIPPRWALGYHQSRWGYRSQEEVKAVVRQFETHDLPLHAIHLDIDYMDGYRVFTVDKVRFPDLCGLTRDLEEKGVKTVLILDPGVKIDPNYSIYVEGKENGFFCQTPAGYVEHGIVWPGWAAFPDFTDPAVREWWGEKYRTLLDQGAAGFWHDMNEPASFTAWGDMTLPKSTVHSFEGQGGDHHQAHNLYGLLMNKAGYETLARLQPEKRPWLLTRAGWAGTARYAWTWTADMETSWESLRQVIPTILGLSLSGIPYAGSDIGGFSGNPDPELYLRWFQLSTFLPFFRTHSSVESPPREPWTFDESILDSLRDHLKLRCRMIPYLYTLAWEAMRTGHPLVRPLFWSDPGNQSLWSIDDEFILGDELLIAPVLEPGATERIVTFPEGDWYSFWDSDYFRGFSQSSVPVTYARIPVFVRSGAILPFESGNDLELHVYPGFNGEHTSRLYSDAGDGYGTSRLDTIRLRSDGDTLHISWEEAGDYPFPYQNILLHLHHGEVETCITDRKYRSSAGLNKIAGRFEHAEINLRRRDQV